MVVTGPRKSGKSEFIKQICEKCILDSNSNGKIPLPMDLGSTQNKGYTIRLFGLPGKENLSFMLDIILKGASGVIVLLDPDNSEHIKLSEEYLKKINEQKIPYVIGLNKQKSEVDSEYMDLANTLKNQHPIIELSTLTGENVNETLDTMVEKILNSEKPRIYPDSKKVT
ncbi:MAG: hypothetical protein ACTSYR_00720 [Candidatus Odinarchaeia archaeon]